MHAWYRSVIRRIGRYLGTDADALFRGTFWLSLGSLAGMSIAFLLSILYARYITKDIYGDYRYVLSVLSALGIFTFPGIGIAMTRSIARGFHGTFYRASRIIFQLSTIVTIAGCGIASYYAYAGQYRIAAALTIGSILIPLVEGLGNWRGLLDGLGEFKTKSLWNSLIKLCYGLGMFIAVGACFMLDAPAHITLISLVGTYYGIHGLGNIIAMMRARTRIPFPRAIDPTSTTYGTHLSFAGAFNTLATYFDSIVIYNILGPEQLALYAFAIAPPEQVKSILSNTALVSYTKLSFLTKDTPIKNLAKTLPLKALRACGISLLIVIAYISAAPLVYHTLFPKYLESIALSQIFSLSLLFFPLGVFHTALDAVGDVRTIYFDRTFAPIIQIALLIILIPLWGLWGAVCARVLGRYIQYGIAYVLLTRTSLIS